jgi:hypothetical protein
MILVLRTLATLLCALLVLWTMVFPLATILAVAFVVPLLALLVEIARTIRPQPVARRRRTIGAAQSSIAA